MTYKVLISDNLSKDIIYKFNEADIDVVYSPEMGKNSSLILNEIHNFDAIAIRSDTKINSALLNKATKLKVIGRAGIGIDNIDLKLASNKGIIVMNTPFGNATTTAEHTMAMIFSSARKIPAANESTHNGKWEKNNFIGTELSGKKLGVVGVGNIGSIVVSLAQSIGMEIIAYDPFLSNERAKEFGCKAYTSFDEMLNDIEVLDIVTPRAFHFNYAKKAIDKGIHLFIEKPVCSNTEESTELLRLSESNNIKIQVGHVERFNSAYITVEENISKPMFIESHRLAKFNPRGTDVSVVLDLMIHDIDIILNSVKSPVKTISSNGISVISDSPDIANARIEFEDGCIANLTSSRISLKKMRKRLYIST